MHKYFAVQGNVIIAKAFYFLDKNKKIRKFYPKVWNTNIKDVNIAKCLHAFFSANFGMQKLFCLLSYGRQTNCQIQSYAYPFDSPIGMDRTKPNTAQRLQEQSYLDLKAQRQLSQFVVANFFF